MAAYDSYCHCWICKGFENGCPEVAKNNCFKQNCNDCTQRKHESTCIDFERTEEEAK
jgi:hypothetical protein